MTKSEVIQELKDKITVLERMTYNFLDVPQVELRKTNKELEICNVCISALEEIQQYREIEDEIKEQYHANVDIKKLMRCFIETIFKGEKHEGFCILTNDDAKMWQKYRAIGTVEECREAKEKQIPKNPIEYEDKYYGCPNCGNPVMHKWEKYPNIPNDKSNGLPYCLGCGQNLDWSDTD